MLSHSALIWTWVAAAIFLFFAVNAAYGIWLQRKKMRGGKSWPTVIGEIVASSVEQAGTHRSDESADCSVAIRYRYQVAGQQYECERLRAGPRGRMTRQLAEELVAKYPAGARVPVHYNPQKPSDAVLEPDDKTTIAALTALLLVLSAVTAVLIAHGIAGKVLTTQAGVPLFAFLIPVAVIGFGIVAVGAYLKLRRERTASAGWPTVMGKITESGVTGEIETSTDDRGRERREKRYRVDIRFAYWVGDRDFHSSHWNWGWTALHSDRSRAEAVAAGYPAGKDVTVYYDPEQPETAVLDPANKTGAAAPLIAGIFCLVAGAFVLWALLNVQ